MPLGCLVNTQPTPVLIMSMLWIVYSDTSIWWRTSRSFMMEVHVRMITLHTQTQTGLDWTQEWQSPKTERKQSTLHKQFTTWLLNLYLFANFQIHQQRDAWDYVSIILCCPNASFHQDVPLYYSYSEEEVLALTAEAHFLSLQALNSTVWCIIYYALLNILWSYCHSSSSFTMSACHACSDLARCQVFNPNCFIFFVSLMTECTVPYKYVQYGTILSHSWYKKDMTLVDWGPHREGYYLTCRRIIEFIQHCHQNWTQAKLQTSCLSY